MKSSNFSTYEIYYVTLDNNNNIVITKKESEFAQSLKAIFSKSYIKKRGKRLFAKVQFAIFLQQGVTLLTLREPLLTDT
jgi:hypothetical protein